MQGCLTGKWTDGHSAIAFMMDMGIGIMGDYSRVSLAWAYSAYSGQVEVAEAGIIVIEN